MKTIKTLLRKEFSGYLNSSIALIFIATFLLISLFAFFWVDKFFERNIADLRPLFNWMPLLLIFLVSALTMRSWAEERSQGTLELLLTWPVKIGQLVLGKFLGVMTLVTLALCLTLALPISVAFIGELDWGPVFGAYLGCLLVAASYSAMGLFVSSLTANQIVSLISSVLLCGFFYLLGSDLIIAILPSNLSEIFRALGTGSRFDSIARGVLDGRDILYYGSLAGLFLTLNIFTLVQGKWSKIPKNTSKGNSQKFLQYDKPHHQRLKLALCLCLFNLFLLNLWLAPITWLRIDLTERNEYSVSSVTKQIVRDLKEPLLIKFYSNETHPLLDPLRPQVRDFIQELEIVSRGKVKGEFIDPGLNEKEEQEANQTYGIRPVPFQVPGRHELKIVNSYFNILVKYGDQHAVLGFDDLIEINVSGMSDIEVRLRNLEYDLAKTIKKVVYGFQGSEELLASIPSPVKAKVFYTSKSLPPNLSEVPGRIEKVYKEFEEVSKGRFSFDLMDLDQRDSLLSIPQVQEKYKIRPFAVSPFTRDVFFLHTVLDTGEKTEVIYPTGNLEENDIRAALEGYLKRQATGILKTVGVWTPESETSRLPPHMGGRPPEGTYNMLEEIIETDYKFKKVDLTGGFVEKDVDVLLVLKPKGMTENDLFAIDQFLMQGGTVLVSSGSFEMEAASRGTLAVEPINNGINDLLSHYGITIEKNLVMDLQNESFPVPITRNLGGFQVQEIQLIRYPFFVDIRSNEMDKEFPSLSGLPALTLNWPSSLSLDEKKKNSGEIVPLLYSSDRSWVSTNTDIQPNFQIYPELGFESPEKFSKSILGASLKGPFSSYYENKQSPLLKEEINQKSDKKKNQKEVISEFDRVIKTSPDSARLVVIGSGEFVNDTVLNISRNTGRDRYINNLQFIQNLIDWALEDTDLLSIRSRGIYARTLFPLTDMFRNIFEWINYGIIVLSILVMAIMVRWKRKNVKPLFLSPNPNRSEDFSQEKAA